MQCDFRGFPWGWLHGRINKLDSTKFQEKGVVWMPASQKFETMRKCIVPAIKAMLSNGKPKITRNA